MTHRGARSRPPVVLAVRRQDLANLANIEDDFDALRQMVAHGVRTMRGLHDLTQAGLALRLGSSQSRVAKIEAADPTVSLDLLVRSFLAAGGTRRQLSEIIATTKR